MYTGCINSVVNHNFTLTRVHLLLQYLRSLCTYMGIFTTDYVHHTAEMVVVETLWQLHTLTVINL